MKRVTIYITPDQHKSLKIKAAETDKDVSEILREMINENLSKKE